jgi:hypothetical protein
MGQSIAARAVEAAVCRESDEVANEEGGRTAQPHRVNKNKKYCLLLAVALIILAMVIFISVDQSLQNRAVEMILDRMNNSLYSTCRRRRGDDD